MTTLASQNRLPPGHALFARYAFPPNELGYCGPADSEVLLRGDNPAEVARYAREFDGSWPYLRAIAEAADIADPLDAAVVRSYWIGGPMLARPDPAALLERLRRAFAGQVTGLLGDVDRPADALAHHCFHVFAVYPWVRFLDRDPDTALNVLQSCRIRWGTVESVSNEHVVMLARPLSFDGGVLTLGRPTTERVRWRRDQMSLIDQPLPGDTVAAHWGWICDELTDIDTSALSAVTETTLEVVNSYRSKHHGRIWSTLATRGFAHDDIR